MTNPLPAEAVEAAAIELAACAMADENDRVFGLGVWADLQDSSREHYRRMALAAYPAIREAVVGEFVLIDKGAVKMVENVLRRAGKDEVADEMVSAIGRAALTTTQEARHDER